MSICDFILYISVGFGVLLHYITYFQVWLAVLLQVQYIEFNLLADHLLARPW